MSGGSSSCGSCIIPMPSSGSRERLSRKLTSGLPGAADLWPLYDWVCSALGTTGETDRVVLLLLRARRKDDVDGLIREARRGCGEHLLERWAAGRGIKSNVKNNLGLLHPAETWSCSRNTFSWPCCVFPGLAALLGSAVLFFIWPGVGHRGGRVCLTAGQCWSKIFSWKCG